MGKWERLAERTVMGAVGTAVSLVILYTLLKAGTQHGGAFSGFFLRLTDATGLDASFKARQ